jgi:carbonic anhydrase/acetyltransferase-like protein (isoleucine patch superfamily)
MIFPSPITGIKPKISQSAFIAENAVIIGDVTIEAGANIWYGAVLRGDRCRIYVGKNTSIQEHVTLHSEPETECIVKDHIIAGHNCIIHGPCVVDSGVMVGINAVVLQGTIVGKASIIAGGSTARKEVPAFTMVAGAPAIVKKNLPPESFENAIITAEKYVNTAQGFIAAGRNHPNLEEYFFD